MVLRPLLASFFCPEEQRTARAKKAGRTVSYVDIKGSNVLDLLVMEETMEEIRGLMTDKHREAIHHYFFREMTQDEAARQMGISQSTFGRLLENCLRDIREKTGIEMTDLSNY